MIGIGIGVGFQMHKGAAVAPAAGNLLLWTEHFENAVWQFSGVVTVTPDTHDSPISTPTADTIVIANSRLIFQDSSVTATGSTATSTVTVTNSWTRFSVTGTFNSSPYTGSVYLRAPLGDVSLSVILQVAVGTIRFSIRDTEEVGPFTIVAWGAQLEQGSSATDYIPRTT